MSDSIGRRNGIDVALGLLVAAGLGGVLFTAVPSVMRPHVHAASVKPASTADAALKPLPGVPPFSLDTVGLSNLPDVVVAGHPDPSVVAPVGTVVRMGGWIVDPITHRHVNAILVIVDGKPVSRVVDSKPRPDVATALRSSGAGSSGFELSIPSSALPRGHHLVRLAAVSASGDGYYLAPVTLAVNIAVRGPKMVRP